MNNYFKDLVDYVAYRIFKFFTSINVNNKLDYSTQQFDEYDRVRNFLFLCYLVTDSNTLNLERVNDTATPSSYPNSRPLRSILEQIKYMKYLHYIDLRYNNMNEKELETLIKEIRNCENLLSIDISHNPIGDKGFRALSPYLYLMINRRGKYNKYLPLSHMNLTTKSIHILCSNLLQIKNVEVINLSLNQIDKRGLEELCIASSSLRKLDKLNIRGRYKYDADFINIITKMKRNCPSLNRIKTHYKKSFVFK